MSAIIMTVESVKTRGSTSEALLTLAVPLEQAAAISRFMSRIGKQVGVAFADPETGKLLEDEPATWQDFSALTQSAILVCKDERFQRFVAERIDNHSGFVHATDEECGQFIKQHCGVTTRKDLERVDGAREKFGALMAEYREWQEA